MISGKSLIWLSEPDMSGLDSATTYLMSFIYCSSGLKRTQTCRHYSKKKNLGHCHFILFPKIAYIRMLKLTCIMPKTVVKTLQDSSLSQQYVSQAIGLPSSKSEKYKKMDAEENRIMETTTFLWSGKSRGY